MNNHLDWMKQMRKVLGTEVSRSEEELRELGSRVMSDWVRREKRKLLGAIIFSLLSLAYVYSTLSGFALGLGLVACGLLFLSLCAGYLRLSRIPLSLSQYIKENPFPSRGTYRLQLKCGLAMLLIGTSGLVVLGLQSIWASLSFMASGVVLSERGWQNLKDYASGEQQWQEFLQWLQPALDAE